MSMLESIATLCLLGSVLILIILSVIDLRTRLLPNEFVFSFATLGAIFHLTTLFGIIPPFEVIGGAVFGFGVLYLIRAVANAYYKQDALGLGDVKLIGAAGIWLGAQGIMMALTAGALAGLIHGLIYAVYVAWKDGTPVSLRTLQIPAGPGFAVGIIAVGAWIYGPVFGPLFMTVTTDLRGLVSG